MFAAVWRYSLALSLASGATILAQPALAHGHHHHSAYSRSTHHDARIYGHRHSAFMVAAAPQAWGEQSASLMSTSSWYSEPTRRPRHRAVAEGWQASSWQSPQNYWQHGWRGHAAQPAAWLQTEWQ